MRKFQRDAARVANALLDALGQHQVMAIAGREIAAGLRDADDRPVALQLLERQAVVQVLLEVQRRQVRIRRVVEPGSRSQGA